MSNERLVKGSRLHLFDASTLIWIGDYYPRDIFPGLWDWLEKKVAEGTAASIPAAREEIRDQETLEWFEKSKFPFLPGSEAGSLKLREIRSWMDGSRYNPESFWNFLNGADARLVAQAGAVGGTVVTQEKRGRVPHESQADHLPHIKIPNACEAFGIGCVDLLGLLRVERVRLKLDPGPC